MAKLIKVYGERHTNTNYISRLIALNLAAREVSGMVPLLVTGLQFLLPGNKEWLRDLYFRYTERRNLGWKHTCVRPWDELKAYPLVQRGLVFLTLTKNPYSWLLSLHRRPYQRHYVGPKPDFETFLREPWPTVLRENTAPQLDNPIELWNIKNRAYLQLDPQRTLNITTESTLDCPERIIQQLVDRLGIARKSAQFINYEASTKEAGKDNSYYRDYYLNERWRSKLSAEAIATINQTVDRQLMAHFGYTVLS